MESGFIVPLQRRSEMKRKMVTSRSLRESTPLKAFPVSLCVRFASIFTSPLISYSAQNSDQNLKNTWKGAYTKSWHIRSNIQGGARNVIPFYHQIKIITSQYRYCKRASECCSSWKMRQMSPICKTVDNVAQLRAHIVKLWRLVSKSCDECKGSFARLRGKR